jgi:hypothetical protein
MKRLGFVGIVFVILSSLNAFDFFWDPDKRQADIKEVIDGTIKIKENIKDISL